MLALAAITMTTASPAHANGAFPDEFSIHFPPNAPHRMLIGANFGLLVSEDDRGTWRYSCEPWVTAGSNGALSANSVSLYQVTADDAVLANSINVTRSADDACTWPTSSGIAAGDRLEDFFADPNDATFVVAIVVLLNPTNIASYMVASHDGGKTFDVAHLYETADLLTAVETARAKPGVVYATTISLSGGAARFLMSSDWGATWTSTNLAIPSGTEPRILTVAPTDEKKVYLRLVTALSDSIFMTADSGQSFQTVLPSIGTALSAFLLAGDGAVYAGTRNGKLYVQPAGMTGFTERDGLHLRCLGQRPGTTRIYACTDMIADGYSLASSDDNALTFQRVMSFRDLLGPLTCPPVQTNCAAHWQRIQGVLGIGSSDAGSPNDAGVPSDGGLPGTSDAGTGGSHSSCSSTDQGAIFILGWIALAFLLRASLDARRRG